MNNIALTSDMLLPLEVRNQITQTMNEYEKAKAEYDKLKENLVEVCEKYGIKKIESEDVRITYKEQYTRETLDSKKLKEELPDVYDSYCKICECKASVVVKIGNI